MQVTSVALGTADVALWLVVRDGLPEVVHWGAPVDGDPLTAALASDPPRAFNGMDSRVAVSVLPESRFGFLGLPGVEGHRDGEAWSPRWQVGGVRVGDAVVQPGEALVTGASEVRLTAIDPDAELDLGLWIELTESGLVRIRAEVTNEGGKPYTVTGVTPRLPVPGRATELLDLAGHWLSERSPQRLPFAVGTHLREGRRGRTGADAATVLHAGVPGFGFREGEVWGVHVGWSGNHRHVAERLSSGRWLGGGELLLPGEVRLDQGETYASPWVYFAYGRGLDDLAHRFHQYLRARPTHPTSTRPVTFNNWEATYFDQRAQVLSDLVDLAAGAGVERFVLDDGWFASRRTDDRGLGDWWVSPDVHPQGLGPLLARVQERGMQFGLWVEPEMVNLDSDVARAHPEWVMQVPGRLPPEARRQHVLNLSIPGCYDHVRNALAALLETYDVAYLKWDHNRDLVEAGDATRGGRPAVHAQTLATYRLMTELKALKPGLEIESCSSGGARADLGVMAICDRIWGSDCTDPVERLRIQRWTYQLLPPELVGAHIAAPVSHQSQRVSSLSMRAVTAFFGHLGIEWDLRQAGPEQLRHLRDLVDVWRSIRDLVATGDLVRGDTAEGLLLTGVVSTDRSRAVYTLTAVEAQAYDDTWGRIALPGLEPGRRYVVRPRLLGIPTEHAAALAPPWWGLMGEEFTGGEYDGGWLSIQGLQTPHLLPGEPVLFEVRAVDRLIPD